MKYEIMEEKHLPQLTMLYVESFNIPPWNDRWTIEIATQRFEHMMKDAGFFGLVAIEKGTVCGAIFGSSEIFYNGTYFNIKEFYMSADKKGSKSAAALLNKFELHLKGLEIREIRLVTSKSDETEVFYQHHDYKSWNNMVVMDKKLKK